MIYTLAKKYPFFNTDSALLSVRIGVGIIFIIAGALKVADIDSTLESFDIMGFVPFWALLVTAIEFLGGIAILLGVYTRYVAIFLAIIMAVAITVTYKDIGLVMTPISLFFSNLALVLAGGGRYSLRE